MDQGHEALRRISPIPQNRPRPTPIPIDKHPPLPATHQIPRRKIMVTDQLLRIRPDDNLPLSPLRRNKTLRSLMKLSNQPPSPPQLLARVRERLLSRSRHILQHMPPFFIPAQRARSPSKSNPMKMFQKRFNATRRRSRRFTNRLPNADHRIRHIATVKQFLQIAHSCLDSRFDQYRPTQAKPYRFFLPLAAAAFFLSDTCSGCASPGAGLPGCNTRRTKLPSSR